MLDGRPHGAVVTLQDRTNLEALSRELDGERSFTESLRAQQHEFSNRMHAIAGLLELDRPDEALDYIQEIRGGTADFDQTLRTHIAAPQIVGLMLGKAAEAHERGIDFTIASESSLSEVPGHVQALTTILGNLIDNAFDALADSRPPRRVTVSVVEAPESLVLSVRDNGPGLPDGAIPQIFNNGYTTKRGSVVQAHRARAVARGHDGETLRRIHHGRRRAGCRLHRRAAARSPPGPGAASMTDAPLTVLVVDDDFRVASLHVALVERVPGFDVIGEAHTAAEALEMAGRLHPDLVLMDIYLPDVDGLRTLQEMLQRPSPPAAIVISAANDVDNVRSALRLGVTHYLVKPFSFAELAERLDRIPRSRSTHRRPPGRGDPGRHQPDLRSAASTRTPPVRPELSRLAPTLQVVYDALASSGTGLSATDIAQSLGMSRATAQRSLTQLEQSGAIALELQYGRTGRPEHRYSIRRRP